MDGTIADLYAQKNWLELLRKENTLPYEKAMPMYDMEELHKILCELKQFGYMVAVTTWTSKGSSDEFKKATAEVKRAWLEENNFPFDFFHAIQYGACKRYPTSPRKQYRKGCYYPVKQILFDDNAEVLEDWSRWHTGSVNANNDILKILKNLLENEKKCLTDF